MKIGIGIIEFAISLLLLCLSLYFCKVKDTKTAVLYLTGDYTDLDTKRICRDFGKRIMVWSIPFLIGMKVRMPEFFSNIYLFDLKELYMSEKEITLADFNFLIGTKTLETLHFDGVQIIDENEEPLKFDKIMAAMPQIEKSDL